MNISAPPGQPQRTPNLIWWLKGEECQNFGDFLTEMLWANLADEMRVSGDAYRLIGSAIADGIIFEDLNRLGKWEDGRIVFWCCGSRDENPLSPDSLARSVFCGVRGPLTRDALRLPAATPIGDPALILPLLHTLERNVKTVGKAVCAPHFLDKNSDQHLLERTGADVIVRPAIANSPQALTQILDELASAEFVLAGSLHAAIVACAYGVPFCYFDDGNVDIPFKWRDFSASVNIGTFFVDNVADGKKIYEAAIRPRLHALLSSFPILAVAPFRVHPEILLKAALHDAERLGKRDRIDVEALSLLVNFSDREASTASANEMSRAVEQARIAERRAQEQVQAAEEAQAQAQARAQELEAEVEKAQARAQGLEAEVEKAQARAQALEAAVEKAQAQAQGLEAAVELAQAQAQGLEAAVENAQAQAAGRVGSGGGNASPSASGGAQAGGREDSGGGNASPSASGGAQAGGRGGSGGGTSG